MKVHNLVPKNYISKSRIVHNSEGEAEKRDQDDFDFCPDLKAIEEILLSRLSPFLNFSIVFRLITTQNTVFINIRISKNMPYFEYLST